MTNAEILKTAMQQSAIDSSCEAADFEASQNKIVISQSSPLARRYLSLPFDCDLTSYGNNIVASVSEELRPVVSDFIGRFPIEHCFETPNLHLLMEALKPYRMSVCFMAEYFLPDMSRMTPLACGYETKVLGPEDFVNLYLPAWSNALCEQRKQLDMLGVGAYHNGKLVGLAACSADCDTMWQIGVDVLPEYRKQGIASALTNAVAYKIMSRGVVPFYCCAWSNIKSARNAIKSGFAPAWVQLTIKPDAFVAGMNKS